MADVNDFCKYGLLRALTDRGRLQATVAWMLTADDRTRDGAKRGYLNQPVQWRRRDPELFDLLAALVAAGMPICVTDIEASGALPHARFHSDLIPRNVELRRAHFARTLDLAKDTELLFFDPDNGLEVSSCRPGQRDSEKYLLWSECADAYQVGHSLLIYQHFPRRSRDTFIAAIAGAIGAKTGASVVLAFRTSGVVFLLVPQPGKTEYYFDRAGLVARDWVGAITTSLVSVA